MKIRPVLRCHVPAYPAIAVAALAAASAVAADKPVALQGKPAPPKTTQTEPKPFVIFGDVAAPVSSPQTVEGTAIVFSNTAFVSTQTLADKLGVTVSRNPKQNDWTLESGARRVVVTPGELEAKVNGRAFRLPTRPMIVGNVLHVPVRSVGEALGFTVVQRGSDIALCTPTDRKMLILQAAPVKPLVTAGVVAAPLPLQGTPAPPPPPKR